MAILWQSSLVPFIDPNGNPYIGAKAFFFDAGTSTPRTVYADGGLGTARDHPVVANGGGMFPPTFLPQGNYRLRIETSSGVTIWDVDNITTPVDTGSGGGGGGDTPIELLARTGDLKDRWGAGSHSGWVRANGRTIGNASSGATERANTDCSDLFAFLWSQDPTLQVSGGRGASAVGDFAAGKRIDLPDLRLRPRLGLASMGNTASTLLSGIPVDGGETLDTLGATLGVATHILTSAQMPAHKHTGTALTAGSHTHGSVVAGSSSQGAGLFAESYVTGGVTGAAGAHTHTLDIANTGGGEAHPNVQPSALVTVYIKL